VQPHPPYDVYSAPICHARELTKPGAEKRTFHFDLDVTDYPDEGGVDFKLIAGKSFGRTSPVKVYADTLYVAAVFGPDAAMVLPDEHQERAIYVADGAVSVDGETIAAGELAVFTPGIDVALTAGPDGAKTMLLGGAAMDGPRHMWWNFVSSSKERIEQAKAEWRDQAFGQVPGETEFIPLPER
jgi:redox-sensitive bicupin YhaK (pirin superfamily)